MIGIPSMDNYIIQYEGKRWEEEGLMTKRHPMACHDPSSWSFWRESRDLFLSGTEGALEGS